ncbi:MAG TPA: MMPL family transporter, partial [Mycobacterium sp.]|nr:MMPL family transporter [Mycobacterium sp.]
MPADSPAMATARQMAEAFHESGSDNVLLAVLTTENGLGPSEEDVYRALVDQLRQDSQDVLMLQDFVSRPALRETLTSKDHQAWIVPIGLAGGLNTPQSQDAYARVVDVIRQCAAGSTLTANLAGPAATIADLNDAGEKDLRAIEIATLVMVLIIL